MSCKTFFRIVALDIHYFSLRTGMIRIQNGDTPTRFMPMDESVRSMELRKLALKYNELGRELIEKGKVVAAEKAFARAKEIENL